MTIVRELPLEDHIYLAAWTSRNRRRAETVTQVLVRVITSHFSPAPAPSPSRPLLSYVEVIDDDPA